VTRTQLHSSYEWTQHLLAEIDMTKILSKVVTGAMALAVLAGPLGAQEGPEARIQAALDRARAANLPVEVLESKLAEGRAKNIPADRIATVIENRARAMELAHAALARAQRGEPSPQDVAVGTDAIEAGVSQAVLARIAETAGAERRTVAIAALAYLVAEGHLPEAALARVQQALAQGGNALANLPGMAGSGQGRGPPEGVGGGPPDGIGRPGEPPRGQAPGRGPPGGN
jgi:hypothetical protein